MCILDTTVQGFGLEPREEAGEKNTRQEFAEADRVFDRKTRNRLEG
jgi:hypothetical protein